MKVMPNNVYSTHLTFYNYIIFMEHKIASWLLDNKSIVNFNIFIKIHSFDYRYKRSIQF